MCPPGLAFVSVSERALGAASAHPPPRFYLDWQRAADAQAKGDTAFTPAVALVPGSSGARPDPRARAREASGRTTGGWRAATRAGVKALGLEPVLARRRLRGWSPPSHAGRARRRRRATRACATATASSSPAARAARGQIMRIGHLGYMNEFDIVTALAGLELALPSSATASEFRAAALPAPPRCSRRSRCRPMDSVLVTEEIAEAGVELLRDRFKVDVELGLSAEELASGSGTTTR